MQSTALLALILFILTITGCTMSHWHKPGSTQVAINRDVYECRTEVIKSYPPVYIPKTDSSISNVSMLDDYTINCTSTPGYSQSSIQCTQKPSYLKQYLVNNSTNYNTTSDVNAYFRNQLFDDCMRARGYVLIIDEPSPTPKAIPATKSPNNTGKLLDDVKTNTLHNDIKNLNNQIDLIQRFK